MQNFSGLIIERHCYGLTAVVVALHRCRSNLAWKPTIVLQDGKPTTNPHSSNAPDVTFEKGLNIQSNDSLIFLSVTQNRQLNISTKHTVSKQEFFTTARWKQTTQSGQQQIGNYYLGLRAGGVFGGSFRLWFFFCWAVRLRSARTLQTMMGIKRQ